ncbi:hypothetical protein C8Q73DRAFT_713572 [Cubamyces lactineus]|nr:hypothetical protein C8Q73DRAFT_713572 [Cubamyces lactineus]
MSDFKVPATSEKSAFDYRYEKPSSPPSYSSPPPYASDAGPSSSQWLPPPQQLAHFAPCPHGELIAVLPGDNPKGFKEHVKNFAPGKSPTKLLDPPPPSFTRIAPPDLPYSAFPAMELVSKGTTLDKGFPYTAPPCAMVPHPFVTHDVNENDWRRFLHDLRIVGSLSPMNRVVTGLMPLLFGLGPVVGILATVGGDRIMKGRKKGPASELVEHWNNKFFHIRAIHVALSKGSSKRDKRKQQGPSQPSDNNWRLIISFRPRSSP